MASSPSPSSSSPPPAHQPEPDDCQSNQEEEEDQDQQLTPWKPTILLAIPVPTEKKSAPVPWTADETANLIKAYQDKWYSLKKGQLKAHQWEEVTASVATRCGYDEPTKTSTQCRHKMEKLRKRYKSEKQKLMPGGRSAWPFFDLMYRMDNGPQPISARPMNMVRLTKKRGKSKRGAESSEEEDEDCGNFHNKRVNSRSRSINNLLKKPAALVNRFAPSATFQRTPPALPFRKREEILMVDSDLEPDSIDDDDDDPDEEEEGKRIQVGNGDGGKRLIMGLATEMRAFAQRIAGVEKRKIEMMRETEKIRMDMEKKRMKMILDSQSKMMDTINTWSSDGGREARGGGGGGGGGPPLKKKMNI